MWKRSHIKKEVRRRRPKSNNATWVLSRKEWQNGAGHGKNINKKANIYFTAIYLQPDISAPLQLNKLRYKTFQNKRKIWAWLQSLQFIVHVKNLIPFNAHCISQKEVTIFNIVKCVEKPYRNTITAVAFYTKFLERTE